MKALKHFVLAWFFLLSVVSVSAQKTSATASSFFRIDKQNLIAPNGKPFLIQGINLGNWLNPEGYMFLFDKTNCFRTIDEAFKEMVGPEFVNHFWQQFQDRYITREDIHFIRQTGMNTVRIPFHYKLFTYEDYMGSNNPQRGFELLDRVISWCHAEGLYVILDMHDAPGGQTGDNIDDSYGYPWLMVNEAAQQQFCTIWKKIARHYANNSTVLGYDLLNEPIAPYFSDLAMLNRQLEPLYKRVVASIRQVDKNHIVLLGGAQWDGNFTVFNDPKFDSKMMYTCHRYGCDTLQQSIQDFLDFRSKVNLPLYMGETGENTDAWIAGFRRLLNRNNMGWTFWPYKKMENTRCMVSFAKPNGWDAVIAFTEKDRSSFADIRKNRPSQDSVKVALNQLLENIEFSHCSVNKGYIEALGMHP
ncbi:MAG: glycoside hydrolase family 5 protein [Microbacter sp.]